MNGKVGEEATHCRKVDKVWGVSYEVGKSYRRWGENEISEYLRMLSTNLLVSPWHRKSLNA